MKLYTFEVRGQRRYGAELKAQLVDLPVAYASLLTARGSPPGALPALPLTLLQFIAAGEPALTAARATLASLPKCRPSSSGTGNRFAILA